MCVKKPDSIFMLCFIQPREIHWLEQYSTFVAEREMWPEGSQQNLSCSVLADAVQVLQHWQHKLKGLMANFVHSNQDWLWFKKSFWGECHLPPSPPNEVAAQQTWKPAQTRVLSVPLLFSAEVRAGWRSCRLLWQQRPRARSPLQQLQFWIWAFEFLVVQMEME